MKCRLLARASRSPCIFFAVLLAVAVAAARPAAADPQSAPGLGNVAVPSAVLLAQPEFVPDAEWALLALLNQARGARGLPVLSVSAPLRAAARSHSREMTVRGFIGHGSALLGSFIDRLRGVVRAGTFVGENVTCGLTVAQIETAFENSSGHLHNMLDPRFRFVGIGIVASPLGLMVTEDFSE